MQLRDFARLTQPVDMFPAGSIGRIVGRCIDQSAYIVEFSHHARIEVTAEQVEAARDAEEAGGGRLSH